MSVLSSRRYLSVWLRRLSTDRIERRSSEPVESLRRRRVDQGRAAHHRPDRRRGAARPEDRHGARRCPRHVSERCRSWTPIRRPTGVCSKPSPTGATAIRRWSASIRRMACCSTSPAARICSAAKRRWPAIWSRGSRVRALRARVAVADTVGCAWGVARYGKPGIVPRGETEAAVLPLPIAALRVDA